ncbi:enoyl-CoA hydratase [Vibrio sp. MACH09]|uniref:enoyl-CoA hydratase/isomerase family protein n=1 Tax=unclassified Vibrio TaxID=2614977 RepID=UPI001493A03B|nr:MULTISPECIES: enoyl-CoA hydratase/isomerase family protein [unclassified Vibrio]NOI68205.1 enoyl-CoA hydratase/isomerase family protein [Vibrio sp. 99-8-1]GLO61117.1 enoyl-CoA hydratase [Vibrio sp. MACH09]
MQARVNLSVIECTDGSQIGVAELDNPNALNALTYTMIEQLYQQLLQWQADDSIVAVLLHARGDKAFCAGGDIQAIYRLLENREQDPATATEAMDSFFSLEYRCDYLIHTYSKPVIAWGHGYLMGGGVGLFMGASQRVAANNTRFAMPEVKIGLYPDVGATYFLNRIEKPYALFLSLTSAQISAEDMKAVGLCHWVVDANDKAMFIEQLACVHWHKESDKNAKIGQLLAKLDCPNPQGEKMMAFAEQIRQLCEAEDLSSIIANISAADIDNKWFRSAQSALEYGSPLSMQISYQQLTQYQNLPLDECFRLEHGLTLRCGMEGDFREGVRSLVIDKSHDPKWLHNDVSSVSPQLLARFFSPICTTQQLLSEELMEYNLS